MASSAVLIQALDNVISPYTIVDPAILSTTVVLASPRDNDPQLIETTYGVLGSVTLTAVTSPFSCLVVGINP